MGFREVANEQTEARGFFRGRAAVFTDENGLLLDDPDHSHEEDRFILLGLSSSLRLIVVSHTYRKDEAVIRIISARKATRSEQKQYWRKW